ncbi:unnamed protein product [Clonostachys rhizophaga]|uniref:Heterokaryon incompatibility domain-containing protein n=1 Tax=Clonostachys rhizophaga TaxID=160324 RepID=A0A9N9YPL6_9HYPO|nr:unnamed protein product [Clonostachys rhizophaga]
MDRADNVLCEKCQGIQLDDRVLSDYIRRLPDGSKYSDKTGNSEEILVPIASWSDYPPEFPKLQESHIKTGCIFCKYLREAVLLSKVEFKESPIDIHLSHNWFNDGTFLGKGDITRDCNYSGIVGHVTDGEAKYGIYFSPGSDDFQISQWLGIYSTPKPVALCKENVLWATNLLENLDHTSARQEDSDHGFLPTRLLDIGETGTPNPRLVSTAKETGTISYCALSYCWGALPQLTTTKSTFQQYSLQGIPLHELTKVFKDAIEVCHTFGIRYLWIDALCIIQDDPIDWERETTMMHRVYRNSYFTICALSSDSTHTSFLQRKQHRLDLNFLSLLDSEISGKLTLEFQRLPHQGAVPFLYRNDLLGDTTWSTRGWTFQEDEMSKAALYFTNSRLFLRTGNQYFTEDGWSSASFSFTLRIRPTLSNWYSKILRFRKKKFANAEDVFPSLSGIVREYISHHDDVYVAGHWKRDFLRGLLWHSVTYELEEGRETLLRNLSFPRLYIAPSWSYLSRTEPGEHGINFHQVLNEGHFRSMVKSADAWTTPAGQDPYGRILAGAARIKGKVITCQSNLSKIHDDIFTTCDIFQIRVDGAYAATCQLDWPVNGDWESSHDLSLLLLGSTCRRLQDGRPTTHYLDKQYNKGGNDGSGSGRSDRSHVGESTDGEPGGKNHQPFAVEESTVSLALLNIKETVEPETGNDEDEGVSRCCESGCAGSSPQITDDETDSDVSSSETSHKLCPICGHCMKCCTSEANRHAWGLIIHPALEPGQYFRVGVFTSRSDGPGSICGTRLFDQADYQEIDII